MTSTGLAHSGLLLGGSVFGILAVFLLQSVLNGFSVTDIMGGILTALVLLLLKKVFDVERNLAALAEQVKSNSEEIIRLRDHE